MFYSPENRESVNAGDPIASLGYDLFWNPDNYLLEECTGSQYSPSDGFLMARHQALGSENFAEPPEEGCGYSDEFICAVSGVFLPKNGDFVFARTISKKAIEHGVSADKIAEHDDKACQTNLVVNNIEHAPILRRIQKAGVYDFLKEAEFEREFIGGIVTYVRPSDSKLRAELAMDRNLLKTIRLIRDDLDNEFEERNKFTADRVSLEAYDHRYQRLFASIALLGCVPEGIGERLIPESRFTKMAENFRHN